MELFEAVADAVRSELRLHKVKDFTISVLQTSLSNNIVITQGPEYPRANVSFGKTYSTPVDTADQWWFELDRSVTDVIDSLKFRRQGIPAPLSIPVKTIFDINRFDSDLMIKIIVNHMLGLPINELIKKFK